jgi:glutathione S-transferase
VEEQALVNQWVAVEAHRFNDAAFAAWSWEYMLAWKLKRPLNEELVGELYAKLTKVFDVYEDQLSKSKYLAGDITAWPT